jgi:hypothetical protein
LATGGVVNFYSAGVVTPDRWIDPRFTLCNQVLNEGCDGNLFSLGFDIVTGNTFPQKAAFSKKCNKHEKCPFGNINNGGFKVSVDKKLLWIHLGF